MVALVFLIYSMLYAVVVAISISVPFIFCRSEQRNNTPPSIWPIFAGPVLATLIFLAVKELMGDSLGRSIRDSHALESALIYLLIGFPPAVLMREMYRLKIPTAFLLTQLFILALIAFIEISCSILIADVQTSMEISNSFAFLGQQETDLVIFLMIIACILATFASLCFLTSSKQQRIFAIGLLVLSAGLIPAAQIYADYVQQSTISAVERHFDSR